MNIFKFENIRFIITKYVENYQDIPLNCWHRIILTFIESVAVGIGFFLSLYFVNTLQLTIATAGLLISTYGAGTALGGILGGKLSDKFSPKIISLCALLIQACTYLLLIKLHNVFFIMANLLCMGIAAYCFKTANNLLILTYCKNNSDLRLKALNIAYAGSNLGLGVSGVIIAAVSSYGFHYIFYFSSLVLFIPAFIMLFHRGTWATYYPYRPISESETNKSFSHARKKVLLVILSCVFAIGLIISQLSATYPVYIQDSFPSLGIQAVTILFMLDTILIVLFQTPLVNYFKHHNKIFITGCGAFLMGMGMLILSFSSLFLLAIFSCVVWTTGEMLFITMAQLVCYENAQENEKGYSLGKFQATYAISVVVGPAVGGLIYKYYGGDLIWYISAVIGISCLLACNNYKKYA